MAFLALIPALMYAIQGASFKQFGLKCDDSKGANALFTTLFMVASAMLSLVLVFVLDGGTIVPDSILLGAIMGVFFFGIITFYDKALQLGPLSITSFVFALSMIVPIIVFIIFFNEPFKLTYAIGLALAIISIIFINFKKTKSKDITKKAIDKKWYLYCILGFIFNAGTLLCGKFHGKFVENGNPYQYLFVNFVVATILSLLFYLPKETRESLKTAEVNGWFIALIAILAIVNVAGNLGSVILAKYLDSAVLYPISNGGTVGISVILSVFFFKEKLQARQVVGLIVGLLAIVVLSL